MTARTFMTAVFVLVAGSIAVAQTPTVEPTLAEVEHELERRTERFLKAVRKRSLRTGKNWTKRSGAGCVLLVSNGIESTRNVSHLITFLSGYKKWLGRNFGDISRRKATKPLIRVCANGKEVTTYKRGASSTYNWTSDEVVVQLGIGTALLGTFSDAAEGLLQHRLFHHDPAFVRTAPEWLRSSMQRHVRSGTITKRSGFFFRAPRGDWSQCMGLMKRGALPPADAIAKSVSLNDVGGGGRSAALVLFRYLTYGAGRKGSTKQLPARLLREIRALDRPRQLDLFKRNLMEEVQLDPPADEKTRLDRLERYFRNLQKLVIAREPYEKLMEQAIQGAYATMKAANWKSLNRGVRNYVKSGLR